MNNTSYRSDGNMSPEKPTLTVRQTTNRRLIAGVLFATIAAYLVLWYTHREYRESFPELYFAFLFSYGYLFQVLRKSQKDPLDDRNTLEFYKDPFTLILLMFVPVGILFLVFKYLVFVSPVASLVWYIGAFIAGVTVMVSAASHKMFLKEHTVTFMHGAFFRKARTVRYEDIISIAVSAATEGMVITTNDGKKETYRFMGNLDNLQKLLQQRVTRAHETKLTGAQQYTFEELADQRLRGVLTDDEFTQTIEKSHISEG